MNGKTMISPVVAGVIAVLIMGVGFGGGVVYQRSSLMGNIRERMGDRVEMRQGSFGNRPDGMMKNSKNGQGSMMGSGVVAGEISAKDDKSITVKMNDGSSRVVIIGSDTKYTESSSVKADKLSVGTKVAVFGETNNGTTTAESIEINPLFRGQQ